MGCWATHDIEYFGDKDLKLQEKIINQKDLQYGLMCTRPFVEKNAILIHKSKLVIFQLLVTLKS